MAQFVNHFASLPLLLAQFANRKYNKVMYLQSHDIVVVLKLVLIGERRWTYEALAKELCVSPSGLHKSVQRLVKARLIMPSHKPIRRAVEEFTIHGLKYVFPPERGSLTRGIPTGYAAPPLNQEIIQSNEHPPVWPYEKGNVRGYKFTPLHPEVPRIASNDQEMYELLALVDAIRGGRAREVKMAVDEFKNRLTKEKLCQDSS